ncbi:hypothetical protein Enr10x_41270 [Gimesia panareensis]|uniref:Uncharacterized protein n=1 Tax=Gimesia panareensis TaxID=2527978 RepID=A0A517QAY4_9PLAN|nr:hypothetical protein [Gimesia panareensis]QDT28781.1 hypothetical protein Enr10x_41270 [Gimesia panareensis]
MSRRGKNRSAFSLFVFQDIIMSVTGIMILITLILSLEMMERQEMSPRERTSEIISQLKSAVGEVEDLEKQFQAGKSQLEDLTRFSPSYLQTQINELTELTAALQAENTSIAQDQKQTTDEKNKAVEQQEQIKTEQNKTEEIQQQIQNLKERLEKMKQENRVIFNPAEGTSKTPWLVEISANNISVAEMGKSQVPSQFTNVLQFEDWLTGRNPASEYFVLLIKPDGIEQFHALLPLLKEKHYDIGFDLLSASQNAIDPQTGAGSGLE